MKERRRKEREEGGKEREEGGKEREERKAREVFTFKNCVSK